MCVRDVSGEEFIYTTVYIQRSDARTPESSLTVSIKPYIRVGARSFVCAATCVPARCRHARLPLDVYSKEIDIMTN